MVKDEADVIEGTIRHMADEVDQLIVADNGSTDGTRDILDKLAIDLPLTRRRRPGPGYRSPQKMSALADPRRGTRRHLDRPVRCRRALAR
jgi:glycosyltransferase involved in cell wall biosynthesis